MLTFIISGGFGDAVSQIAKALQHQKNKVIRDHDTILYIRDSIDEQILDQAQSSTRDYIGWVKDLALKNHFLFETITGDQKQLCEELSKKENHIILGPNLCYDLKIFEPQRGLYIGFRPNETQITIDQVPIHFKYNKIKFEKKTIAIQVRFGDEYPTKYPNASWDNVLELVNLVLLLAKRDYHIILVGETKKNIESLAKIATYKINTSVTESIDYILSADGCIGFSGWFSGLTLLSDKKLLRMLWDQAEKKLQVPTIIEKNCFDFTHDNLYPTLETYLRKI